MEKEITNRIVQASIQGLVKKTCWAMLWQKKELHWSSVTKKNYRENSVMVAFKSLVDSGYAIKDEKMAGVYRVNPKIKR